MHLRLMFHIFRVIILTPFALSVTAQEKFQGDVDDYLRKLPRSLEFIYNTLSDGAGVQDEISMFAEGFTETYVYPGGVFIPDFMEYNSKSAQFSVENYLLAFFNQYSRYISQGSSLEFELSDLNVLDAYWTDDKKGIVLNVVYNNKLKADGKVVYQGKSQAILVYPKYSNTTEFLVKQLSSCKGSVPASVARTNSSASTVSSRSGAPSGSTAMESSSRSRNTTSTGQRTSSNTSLRQSAHISSSNTSAGNAVSLFKEAEKADKQLDYSKAVSLYSEAVRAGSLEAMVKMGMNYEYGYGDVLAKDFAKAAAFYRQAADAGSIEGCYRFAMCLRKGRGVRKNVEQARALLEVAARNGHKQAALELNKL